jgi:hypothetical protein
MRTIHAAPLLLSLLLPAAATADQPPPETYDVCDEVPHDAQGRPVPDATPPASAPPADTHSRPEDAEATEEVADAHR